MTTSNHDYDLIPHDGLNPVDLVADKGCEAVTVSPSEIISAPEIPSETETSTVQDSINTKLCQTQAARFIDNGDRTVTDTATGLMWAKCAICQRGEFCKGMARQMPLKQAIIAAKKSRLGNYCDWRIPDSQELSSLILEPIEDAYPNPLIDTNYFPNTPATEFWSSTVERDSILGICFLLGVSEPWDRSEKLAVRLVRGRLHSIGLD